jgi:hypothetical protein
VCDVEISSETQFTEDLRSPQTNSFSSSHDFANFVLIPDNILEDWHIFRNSTKDDVKLTMLHPGANLVGEFGTEHNYQNYRFTNRLLHWLFLLSLHISGLFRLGIAF